METSAIDELSDLVAHRMRNGPSHQVRLVWTEDGGKLACDYMDFHGRVGGLCTGKDFVIATRDCRVLKLSIRGRVFQNPIALVLLHSSPITCVDAHGSRVVVGDIDGCLATGSCGTGHMCPTRPLGNGPVHTVKWAPDNPVFAAGDEGGTPSLWTADGQGAPRNVATFPAHNAQNPACTCEHGILNIREPGCSVSGHVGPVYAVDHVRNGIVTGGADGTVRVWDAETLESNVICDAGYGSVNSIAVNKWDQHVVAVACSSGPIRVLDTRASKPVMHLGLPTASFPWVSVDWRGDKLIAFDMGDNGVRYRGPWNNYQAEEE